MTNTMNTPWTWEGRGDTFGARDCNDKLLFEIPYVEEPGIEAIDTASGKLVQDLCLAINSHAALVACAEALKDIQNAADAGNPYTPQELTGPEFDLLGHVSNAGCRLNGEC